MAASRRQFQLSVDQLSGLDVVHAVVTASSADAAVPSDEKARSTGRHCSREAAHESLHLRTLSLAATYEAAAPAAVDTAM